MDSQSMFYGARRKTFLKAVLRRQAETLAEKLLWKKVNENQILGLRFRRQHPISNYIADFYCHKAKLVIEIDEEYHNQFRQKKYDEDRTTVLEQHGLHVLRFTDVEIYENIDAVIKTVEQYIRKNL